MAEEYKNNVPEHETTPKVATEESSATTPEVKDRGLFDFLKKKEEVKPQEKTNLASEFEHKPQISEPEPFVAKHDEEEPKEHKATLIEQLHQKHEEEEEGKKPSLLDKLHRSNSSSSSSSSDEEGENGEKRKKKKKDKKKISEGDEKTEEEEKKGVMDKIKEKLPGHSKKPEDTPVVSTTPLVETATPITEHTVDHPAEKKGILEKIKEKFPGYHAKTSGEEENKEKESD